MEILLFLVVTDNVEYYCKQQGGLKQEAAYYHHAQLTIPEGAANGRIQ